MSRGTADRENSMDDGKLVERARNGCHEAFAELVRRYQDRIVNTCWRICGNYDDAVDLAQDAFMRVYERLDSFRQESAFYTWLFRVAVNLALSDRRSAKRRRTLSLDAGGDAIGAQAERLVQRIKQDANDAPDDAARNKEARQLVVRALDALDEAHRAVLVLRDLEGFDYLQIGEILDIPPGTVRSRLHRARMSIRAALAPLLGFET